MAETHLIVSPVPSAADIDRGTDQGIPKAQNALGVLYAQRGGVPEDTVAAAARYRRAALSNEEAGRDLHALLNSSATGAVH